MQQRTQIYLPPEEHRRARRRAAELGVSLAEYVRRLVRQDLGGSVRKADVSGLFALGDSGDSDVAKEKDAYIGDAVGADSKAMADAAGHG
jgi:NAD+--asparagine ADP-ribosyltransferase